MTATNTTTVRITIETRDRLIALGGKGDSYEDVIKRLLDAKGLTRLLGVEDKG